MLFQEKEKQIFDFSVASEFTQIRCKALSVKTQLLWQRLCALRGFCSCFPPCGVDRLPICRWRRALRLNKRHCLLVQCIAIDLAHLDERRLRSLIVICDQVGAGQIQLLGRILHDLSKR